MLAKRIIPSMLVRGQTLVKGEQFDGWRSIGHALQAAKIHATRGVDELCILDITATAEGRGPDLELIRELSDGCFIPITVGGGIQSLQHIDQLLRAGADKVCIGAAQFTHPNLIPDASRRFGSQAIVASVDVRDGKVQGLSSRASAMIVEAMGAGEILLQCVERDGTLQGYDLDLIRDVSAAVSIPVIASGGCGNYQHMLDAYAAGADACAAGAVFAFTDATPKGAARFLKSQGLEVRT